MNDHQHLMSCVSRLVRGDGTRAACDCGTTPQLLKLQPEGSLPAYVGFIREFLEELHHDAALMLERDAMRNRIDRVTVALDCIEDALARIQAVSFEAQEKAVQEAQEAGEAEYVDVGPPAPGESFGEFDARQKRAQAEQQDRGVGPRPLPPQGRSGA